jgi:hypothetical protein
MPLAPFALTAEGSSNDAVAAKYFKSVGKPFCFKLFSISGK